MKRKQKKKKKAEKADNKEELEKQQVRGSPAHWEELLVQLDLNRFVFQAEMALLMEDDTDDPRHAHFNYDQIVEQQNLSKKKRKKLLKKGEELLEDDSFQVRSRF